MAIFKLQKPQRFMINNLIECYGQRFYLLIFVKIVPFLVTFYYHIRYSENN